MKQQEGRVFVSAFSGLSIGLGGLCFLSAWFLGQREMAWGILGGVGIGMSELLSTALLYPRVLKSGSRLFWGIALALKSVLILSLLGILLLGLKLSGLGFIIGFSITVLGILGTTVWLGGDIEGRKDEGISNDR